jgi:NADH dehydrogenase
MRVAISNSELKPRRRTVIVGGGAGGLEVAVRLARRFDKTEDELVLVDGAAAHLWKPRLHEVAAGLLPAGEDEVSYLGLAQARGFHFHLGLLSRLDPEARVIGLGAVRNSDGGVLLGEREINYDDLVLAFGSKVNDFGIEGVAEHCHMLDSVAQAEAFNRAFLNAALQIAEGERKTLSVCIVGAGATGVELSAELWEAAHNLHLYGGLSIGDRLKLTLVDLAPRVLPGTDERISKYAATRLTKLGVRLKLGAAVSRVEAGAIHLKDGEVIACDLRVWASGIVGQPVVDALGVLQLDRSKRIVTDQYGACAGVEHIYAIGDCAAMPDGRGAPALPASAQVAHQQAGYLADNLLRRRAGKTLRPFVFRPRGTLVSLGGAQAVGEFPGLRSHQRRVSTHGRLPKLLYVSLQFMHRVSIYGWLRATAIGVAERLRHIAVPPIKLH